MKTTRPITIEGPSSPSLLLNYTWGFVKHPTLYTPKTNTSVAIQGTKKLTSTFFATLEEVVSESFPSVNKWTLPRLNELMGILTNVKGVGPKRLNLYNIVLMGVPLPLYKLVDAHIKSLLFIQDDSISNYEVNRYGLNSKSVYQPSNIVNQIIRILPDIVAKDYNIPITDHDRNMFIPESIADRCEMTSITNGELVGYKPFIQLETKLYDLAKQRMNGWDVNITNTSKYNDIVYMMDDSQIKFIKAVFDEGTRVIALNAPPGYGKSEIIAKIHSVAVDNNLTCAISAPTNKACINLNKRIENYEYLGWDFVRTHMAYAGRMLANGMTKKYNTNTDILIIDESSMISTQHLELIHTLVSIGKISKLVFVGDIDQLPPIQVGFPFMDIIKNNIADHYSLSTYYRSTCDDIEDFLSRIRTTKNGEFVNVIPSDNIHPVKCNKVHFFNTTVPSMWRSIMNRKWNVLEEIAMISPTNHISRIINYEAIKSIAPLNVVKEMCRADKVYDMNTFVKLPIMWIGAKVKATKNMADLHIFNNMYGVVTKVTDSTISIKSEDGVDNTINKNVFNVAFEPAFCSTIHSYQGSQAKRIVYILDSSSQNGDFYSRNLLYTGMSRTQKELYIYDISHNKDIFKKSGLDLIVRDINYRVTHLNTMTWDTHVK